MERREILGIDDILAGYNMTVVSIGKTKLVVSIGGSERELDIADLAEQLNVARQELGASVLLSSDMEAIKKWSNQPAFEEEEND